MVKAVGVPAMLRPRSATYTRDMLRDPPQTDRFWQWHAGVRALEELLRYSAPSTGFLVSSPSLILEYPALKTYVLAQGRSLAYLPAQERQQLPQVTIIPSSSGWLSPFCLVLSAEVSVLLVYQPEQGLRFSFAPEEIYTFWQHLRQEHASSGLKPIDEWLQEVGTLCPSYRLVSQFGQWLLDYSQPVPAPVTAAPTAPDAADVNILQALAHEVRTPLTTINTFIQLLQRQQDLPQRTYQYLHKIGQEIHEQMTRFDLLTQAAEMLSSPASKTPMALGRTCLQTLLTTNLPRWQKQAARRQVSLALQCPANLPVVLSDPESLDQVLTGLVEYYSQTLAAESALQLVVQPAGHQVKLELRSPQYKHRSDLASLGQLLLWHPATGQLSLNFQAAKLLIEAVGAKVTQRHDRHAGEILTLYLPIARDSG
ncbi:sensor histidine kinase [Parathermosynechococcus lividus]